MIVESILNMLKKVVFALFSWLDLPNMSDYGDGFDNALSLIFQILESTQSVIDLLLPWEIVVFSLPIVIVIDNFEHIYNFIMWVVRKIPMLNIK